MLLLAVLLLGVVHAQVQVVYTYGDNACASDSLISVALIGRFYQNCSADVPCAAGVRSTCNDGNFDLTRLNGPSLMSVFPGFCPTPAPNTIAFSLTTTGYQVCVKSEFLINELMNRYYALVPSLDLSNTGSFWFECGGDRKVVVTSFADSACSVNATVSVSRRDVNRCLYEPTLGSSIFVAACTENVCFHEDTVIGYNNKQLSLADIKANKEPECTIPHEVQSDGVVLEAECGGEHRSLKLTGGHLVHTQRGLQPAKDITTLDTVFGDVEQKQSCRVLSVKREAKSEKYFGLNCHNSEVLAQGIKASTFEKIHSVPSFWMSVMGKVLGIKRASLIGDYIESLVSSLNLV